MPITPRRLTYAIFATVTSIAVAPAARAQQLPPIRYIVSMPAPETHLAHVQARIPTGAKPYVDLMMAVWSPGYYVQENYATHVPSNRRRRGNVSARAPLQEQLP